MEQNIDTTKMEWISKKKGGVEEKWMKDWKRIRECLKTETIIETNENKRQSS